MKNIVSEINEIVGAFSTQPYLFIGSGFSKRYLDTPTWKGLLYHLIEIIRPDKNTKLEYGQIANEAKGMANNPNSNNDIFSSMATIIESEFNKDFFNNECFRKKIFDENEIDSILDLNENPFKRYLAKFFMRYSQKELLLQDEINALLKNKVKIAGVITTNYDLLLERLFPEFNVYKDQFELLGSMSYSFSEIYKIHGCCTKTESLVFTNDDYELVKSTNTYLASKLLTSFIEFPIIFIGYGLQDEDIRMIFENISRCLNNTHRQKLRNRIIFLGIPDDNCGEGIYRRTEQFQNQYIEFIDIRLNDFTIFYNALELIKPRYRVDLARKLFSEVSQIVINNSPSNTIYATALQNPNIKGDELACYIGTKESIGSIDKGLIGLKMDEIYCDIIFDNLQVINNDFLLKKVFMDLRRNASRSYFPIYKYGLDLPEYIDFLEKHNFKFIKDDVFEILTEPQRNKIKNNVQLTQFNCISDIEAINKDNMQKNLQFISYSIKKLKIEDVVQYIKNILKEPTREVIGSCIAATDLRKLICMCDYILNKK